MRVTQQQMQANRIRVLDAAARLFREKGFEAVSVAEVMKAAGMTHGGFYGHFASKDELIAEAIAHIFEAGLDENKAVAGDLDDYLDAYLSPRHRDHVGPGCPTAALVADVRRQSPAARRAMTEGFKTQVEKIAATISSTPCPEARREAVGTWASLVGALVLSRTIEDEGLSDEILRDTRAWISRRAASPTN